MTPNETIFEKIIKGEIPCTKIYEDEHTLAFLDIKPNNLGHTLVIPKEHSANIYEMSEESTKNVFATVRKVAKAIKIALSADGINLVMNNEPAAGQDVFHSHIHVIPRFDNDGFKKGRHLEYKEGEMEEIAERIKRVL